MRQAAVAAVLRASPELELLFIRRAEHPSDPWSGHMAFPGGRVDPGDPTPLDAARRETREEIALDLGTRGQLLGELSHLPAAARGRLLPMVIHPFVFGLEQLHDPLRPNPLEVAEAVWVPLDFLRERANRGTLQKTYAGVPMTLPCYRYQGRVIWGLTLRMLDELLLALG